MNRMKNDRVNIQTSLFEDISENVDDSKSSTFQDNMKLPIHRWYRYTAGFSASWVGSLIEEEKINGRNNIIDPFVGSGTVLVESSFHNVNAYGVESHPYVYKIAKAKLQWRNYDTDELLSQCELVLEKAKKSKILEKKLECTIDDSFYLEVENVINN